MNCKNLFQNFLLVLGSLVFMILLAEILLRVLLPSPIVWKLPQEAYVFDPEMGHRLQQRQQAFTHDKSVNINSQGIRDTEYESESAAKATRILALGDSQTFGNGIEQADTWPKQLEQRLNEQADVVDYEVLNGGLPASDTWQHEILLERLILTYNPDVVVLAFYVNDIVNKPALITTVVDDDAVSIDHRLVYLFKRSVLLLSLRSAYEAVRQLISPQAGFQLQNALLAGQRNPVIDKRWGQVEESLSNMKKITENNNASFLVISLPRRDQVDGRLPARKYSERLSAIAKRSGIQYVGMLGSLQRAFKEHGEALFIPWDGHNSAVANSVIAGEIAVILRPLKAGLSP